MKNQIKAMCINMLNRSSELSKSYIKFESNDWGSADTLYFKYTAQATFDAAMTLAREFGLDVRGVLSNPEFLRADELPRSKYQ